jgi:hypothetical protein
MLGEGQEVIQQGTDLHIHSLVLPLKLLVARSVHEGDSFCQISFSIQLFCLEQHYSSFLRGRDDEAPSSPLLAPSSKDMLSLVGFPDIYPYFKK